MGIDRQKEERVGRVDFPEDDNDAPGQAEGKREEWDKGFYSYWAGALIESDLSHWKSHCEYILITTIVYVRRQGLSPIQR